MTVQSLIVDTMLQYVARDRLIDGGVHANSLVLCDAWPLRHFSHTSHSDYKPHTALHGLWLPCGRDGTYARYGTAF